MKRTNLRIGCLLLVLVLLLGVLPVTALADEVEERSPIAEMKWLCVFASYDGECERWPIYCEKVGVGTPIVEHLKDNVSLNVDGYTYDAWYKFKYPFNEKFTNYDTVSGWTNVLVKYTSVPQSTKTVTFVSTFGEPPVTMEFTGDTVPRPDDPTMEGYNFLGWYTEDGILFEFSSVVTSSLTLYAKWEKIEETPVVHYYLDDNFPARLEVGTYKDVSLTVFGDRGCDWQYDAYITVSVKGPAWSDAQLLYYTGSGWDWWWNGYVDTVDTGKIPATFDFNEIGTTVPLSLYLDKAGTYKFTFTLYASDGTVLATDTATVKATEPAHDDYRVYLDCGKHGSISTRPSTWADYKDTVTIYVSPDKGYELDTLKVYDAKGNRISVYTDNHGDYYFTMPNRSVTVYATFQEVGYDHFTDVPKGSWYYDAVYYVYNHEIMDGVGGRKFNPYGDLSRAMIVTTLYRLEGEPTVRTSGTFRDVPYNTWYSDAVEWAAKEGIVKGYGKKTFGPSNSVTVEQLAAILQRYADYKGYDVDQTVQLYADAVVSQWAVKNVRWAAAEGLLRDGRSTNATLVATRAEIAYALYGFMTNVVE